MNRCSTCVISLSGLIDISFCAAFKDIDDQAADSADISGLCLLDVGILQIRVAEKCQAMAIASSRLYDLRPDRFDEAIL